MPLSDADKIINLEDLAAFKAKMDESVLHKIGTETVSGEKVFSGSQTTPSGNASALIVVKDPNLVKGETPETNHYLSLGFIDSTGDSYAQDTASRLAVVEYKSPSESDPEGYMQLSDMGFNGGGSATFRVGHDKDNIRYATAPATSEDRTNSTDIVTRDYLPKSKAIPQFLDLWNWQKTKKAGAVAFKPVPESDLEPVVDFMFTETLPAEGEKGPENPSTITGVTQAKVTRCGKNLLPELNEAGAQYGVTYTPLADGGYRIYGETDGTHHSYVTILESLTLKAGVQYTVSFTSATTVSGVSIIGKDSNNSTVFSANLNAPVTLTGDGKPLLVRFVTNRTAGAVDLVAYPQIELGITATAFEPYEGNDYTIQLGNTYYGGSLDVASGVMTVTHGAITLDGTESFLGPTDLGSGIYRYDWTTATAYSPVIVSLGDNGGSSCSHFNYIYNSTVKQISYYIGGGPRQYINIKSSISTLEDFKAWLASEYSNGRPVTITGFLREPFTVQLTPIQIRSLSALDKYEPRINTVYTDQEAVQVGYQRYVGGAVKALGTTTARTLPERFADVVNVKDFGAKGDGSDAAAEIQAAVDAAYERQCSVFVPAGTYGISTAIKLKDKTTLIGESMECVKFVGSSAVTMFDGDWDTATTNAGASVSTGGLNNVSIKNITVDGDNTAVKGIACYGVNIVLHNITVRNCKDIGICIESPGDLHSWAQNLQNDISNITCHGNGNGNFFYNGQSDSNIFNILAFGANVAIDSSVQSYPTSSYTFNFRLGPKGSGCRVFGLHSWSLTQNIPVQRGIWNEALRAVYTNCCTEGSSGSQFYTTKPFIWVGGLVYLGNFANDSVGFFLNGTDTGGSYITATKIVNIKTAVYIQGSPKYNTYQFTSYNGQSYGEGSVFPLLFDGHIDSTDTIDATLWGIKSNRITQTPFDNATVGSGRKLYSGVGFSFYNLDIAEPQFAVESSSACKGYVAVTKTANGGRILVRPNSGTGSDLELIPGGGGSLRLGGTFTELSGGQTATTVGTITIKDANGNVRYLPCVTVS